MSEEEGNITEGTGSDGGEPTFTQADIDAAVQTAVAKLEGKNSELIGTQKNLKSQLKAWEGLDPTAVKDLMEKVQSDEVLALHAEGKHNEAYDKMMEKERATFQSQFEGLTGERDEFKNRLEASEAQVRDLIVDQAVVTSFIQEKGLDSAIPDIVLRAKQAFTIEDGQAVCRDQNGELVRGADGPITIAEWVAERKKDCAHWWPSSQGAGAAGAGQGGAAAGGGSIEERMAVAAANKDMDTYRKLHEERRNKRMGAAPNRVVPSGR
jgi:hypothetical protein